jgi:hypothetical protein
MSVEPGRMKTWRRNNGRKGKRRESGQLWWNRMNVYRLSLGVNVLPKTTATFPQSTCTTLLS